MRKNFFIIALLILAVLAVPGPAFAGAKAPAKPVITSAKAVGNTVQLQPVYAAGFDPAKADYYVDLDSDDEVLFSDGTYKWEVIATAENNAAGTEG